MEDKIMESYNKFGTLMKIIEYKNYDNITIEFQDEYKYKTKTNYTSFKLKTPKNPYDKIYFGVGFLGETTATENDKQKYSYIVWRNMLMRCYDKKIKDKVPTYEQCFVCDDWLCYANFEKWFNINYYNLEEENMQIDKDILNKRNKEYCQKHCIFVPRKINSLFTKRGNDRGNCAIGVIYRSDCEKYYARLDALKELSHLGSFNTEDDAFNAYKIAKEKYIKEVADEYKSKYINFPQKLYDAMYSYQVERTD